jgi:hypothetical protein
LPVRTTPNCWKAAVADIVVEPLDQLDLKALSDGRLAIAAALSRSE